MSSLFSMPRVPNPAPVISIPAPPPPPPPPAPLPPAPPLPLPAPTIAPIAVPTVATNPTLATQIDPTAAAANALAMRNRGIQSTISTSFVGVPAAASLAGNDFSVNSRLPQRKTLLGE